MSPRDLDLEQSPSYQLWLATNAWQRLVRKKLEPLGLTHVQFVVLASLSRYSERDECVTQAKVCRFAELDENMTSQVIRLLERRGFVRRVQHPTDGRAHRLQLTEEGASVAEAARTVVRAASRGFFEPLEERRDDFVESLKRLHAHAEA